MDNNQLFASLVDDVGGFGFFQKRLLVMSLFACVLCACNHLGPIYLAFTPKHTCVVSSTEVRTYF